MFTIYTITIVSLRHQKENSMRQSILITCFILLFSATALAASPKLGIVNMQKIIVKSEPGQDAMNKLQEKFKGAKDEMDQNKKELDAMRQAIQNQGVVLSQEAKEDKEIDYKRKVRDFQDMYRNYQRKIKQEEQKLSQPVIKTIVEVITDYGKKQNYTTITDAQGSGLIYADDSIDLTDTIIVEVNRSWRASQKKQGKK